MSEDIKVVAKKALNAYEKWLEADGAFPEPEYDVFCDKMNALAKAVNYRQGPITPLRKKGEAK